MKTVVRNNKEETEVRDTWYALITDEEIKDEEFGSPLYKDKDKAFDVAYGGHDGTIYVAEIKLITKVVG